MEGMTREETVEWWLEWMRLTAAPGDAVGLEFAERGEHELKGVPGAWRVYAVV
jgi:hypothetical protein